MTTHPIIHIELAADDPTASAKFYADVFGWKTEEMPEMNYVTFDAEGGPGGGFNPTDNDDTNPGDILIYIQTEDIEASLAKIEAAGGKTLLPKSEIPGIGWYALFADLTGNRVGLYKSMGAG